MFLVSSCPPLSRKPHTVAGILDAVIPYQIPVRINGEMRSIHTQEEKQLTDFSQSMVQAYREDKKYENLSQTDSCCQLLSHLAEQFVTATGSYDRFEEACWNTVNAYLQTMMFYDNEDILFIYGGEYFFTPNGLTRDELEAKVNAIYLDEDRQCEAEFDAADGYEWLHNFDFGDSYIEKKDGMICIAFTMPRLNPNAERIKVGIIRETHDAALLDSTAQELVLEIAENTNAHDQTVFRRAMLVMTLSVLLILLLCLLYTRRIAGYVADPIELKRLRSRQEKEALEEANRMKTAFLSDVSHELKTPLAAMSGYAQNASMELTGNGDMDSVQEMLQRISSEANRIDMTGNHKKAGSGNDPAFYDRSMR